MKAQRNSNNVVLFDKRCCVCDWYAYSGWVLIGFVYAYFYTSFEA
jgi:hypothetical protein